MHYFSIDSDERKIVPAILAIIAVGANAALLYGVSLIAYPLPAAATPPSAFVIYGILYLLFDRFAWRWAIVRNIGLVKTPILRGNWKGLMTSSLDDYKKEFGGPIVIDQTWTKIHIYFRGDTAFSHSQSASFVLMSDKHVALTYVYQSEIDPEHSNNDESHFGTCRIEGDLLDDGTAIKFDGSYFTDKGRHTYGKITHERVEIVHEGNRK